ncbi:unnamed protein product [Discosporangium mesarthrocarpum]
MGYMHQVGMGVPLDLHMAKRYYDMAAEISDDAVLPVRIALLSLRCQSFLDRHRDWWMGTTVGKWVSQKWESPGGWEGASGAEQKKEPDSKASLKSLLASSDTALLVLLLALLYFVLKARRRQARRHRPASEGN